MSQSMVESSSGGTDSHTTLSFGIYDFDKYGYVTAPVPKLNGGLYSGEPFAEGASYASVPVVADVDNMMYHNLASANSVSEARLHYPSNNRPGNSMQEMPGLRRYSAKHNILCISDSQVGKIQRPDEVVKRVIPHDPMSVQSGRSTTSHAAW
jgi:hypothetical protein